MKILQVVTSHEVDTIHPLRTLCTRPWTLELATLAGLWRGLLLPGLVAPAAVPRAEDIVQYTVVIPELRVCDSHVPHSMLVFFNEDIFGQPPTNLREMLLDNVEDLPPNSKDIREQGIHCFTTFNWTLKSKEATFWMTKEAFDEIKEWLVYIWRTDDWERDSTGVKLRDCIVKQKGWGEWDNSASLI